jgi:hypothetical protein
MENNNDKELLQRAREYFEHNKYVLRDIWGDREYYKHIEAGDKFYYVFSSDSEESRLAGYTKVLITITGVRSGVAFYTLENHPEKEFYFALKSPMGAFLEPVNMDEFVELFELAERRRAELNGEITSFPLD